MILSWVLQPKEETTLIFLSEKISAAGVLDKEFSLLSHHYFPPKKTNCSLRQQLGDNSGNVLDHRLRLYCGNNNYRLTIHPRHGGCTELSGDRAEPLILKRQLIEVKLLDSLGGQALVLYLINIGLL